MSDSQSKKSVVKVSDGSIFRYSNALVRRGLKEIAGKSAVQENLANLSETHIKSAGILVVDDEQVLTELLKDRLQFEGFKNVYTAFDGVECLEVMEKLGEKIQVITSCINMPKMSGLEAVRILSEHHPFVVGVVMMTAMNNIETARKFFELGKNNVIPVDYFYKPIDFDEMRQSIEKAIQIVQTRRFEARNSQQPI